MTAQERDAVEERLRIAKKLAFDLATYGRHLRKECDPRNEDQCYCGFLSALQRADMVAPVGKVNDTQ